MVMLTPPPQMKWNGCADAEFLAAYDHALACGRFIPPGFIDAYKHACPFCETPIECPLYPWLLCQLYIFGDRCVAMPALAMPKYLDSRKSVVIPQFWLRDFRVDFAIVSRAGIEPPQIVVVEVDGAQYHHNKEADKARERVIRDHPRVRGIVRLSGAEVNANPRAAARKAAEYHAKVWSRNPLPPDEPPSGSAPVSYQPYLVKTA